MSEVPAPVPHVTRPAPLPARRRRWRKPVLIGLGMFLLVGGTALGIWLYLTGEADARLREAIAEADRLDPGWRLEELEARRATVRDEENSAPLIMRIAKQMPQDWGADQRFWALFEDDDPEPQLNTEQIKALREELGRAAAALAEARKLKDFPKGRFPITYAADGISTNLPHIRQPRQVATMLEGQAELLSQEGAADAAVEACQAMLNCGRSLGDEPTSLTQLVRIAVRTMSCRSIERTLAHGEPSVPSLLRLQQLLELEEPEPLVLYGARGDRASLDRMMAAIQRGECSIKEIQLGIKMATIKPGMTPDALVLAEDLVNSPLGLKHQRAGMLRYMNRVVEALKVPNPGQMKRLRALEAELPTQPVLVKLFIPAVSAVAEAEQRNRALLQCSIVALAAERYRRERGNWPAAPSQLTAKGYLKRWPEDPYDGAPVRWKRLKDGVVIYTLGPDGADNGGTLNREMPLANGADIGFRLWDVAHRRQPPRPPRPREPGPPDEEPGEVPNEKGP